MVMCVLKIHCTNIILFRLKEFTDCPITAALVIVPLFSSEKKNRSQGRAFHGRAVKNYG